MYSFQLYTLYHTAYLQRYNTTVRCILNNNYHTKLFNKNGFPQQQKFKTVEEHLSSIDQNGIKVWFAITVGDLTPSLHVAADQVFVSSTSKIPSHQRNIDTVFSAWGRGPLEPPPLQGLTRICLAPGLCSPFLGSKGVKPRLFPQSEKKYKLENKLCQSAKLEAWIWLH